MLLTKKVAFIYSKHKEKHKTRPKYFTCSSQILFIYEVACSLGCVFPWFKFFVSLKRWKSLGPIQKIQIPGCLKGISFKFYFVIAIRLTNSMQKHSERIFFDFPGNSRGFTLQHKFHFAVIQSFSSLEHFQKF